MAKEIRLVAWAATSRAPGSPPAPCTASGKARAITEEEGGACLFRWKEPRWHP